MNTKEYVILLHGLLRTSRSMRKLKYFLERSGYCVINEGYPSRKYRIDKLSELAIGSALEKCVNAHKIHFITHSMGGILVRYYLDKYVVEKLGRVVMLAPPNHGSEIVDKCHKIPGFKFVNGPAVMMLGTQKRSFVNQLKNPNFDLGIIAGNKSINFLFSKVIAKPNDGKVSLESTQLTGMSDHILLPTSHTFMMNNKEVIDQALFFIINGKFYR